MGFASALPILRIDSNAEKAAKVKVVFHSALRNQVGKAVRVIREGPIVRWELMSKD